MKRHVWKIHRPKHDGQAPKDWVDGMEYRYRHLCVKEPNYIKINEPPAWLHGLEYIYDPESLQDATYEPDLLAQCLALPQADRDALIEALQKPQRDWADDVWDRALSAYHGHDAGDVEAAAVIRSMCRPREVELSDKFLYQRFADILEAYDMKNAAREIREGTCKDADLPEAIKALRNIIREALS